MTMSPDRGEPIVRIAARGDGVTASGCHRAGTAPGDTLLPDGTVLPGPHRQAPPCRHFDACGGCQLQHVDDAALAEFVTARVLGALEGQGLPAPLVVHPAHLSPPRTRRRASLKALATAAGTVIGFNEAGSHRIVDLAMCEVLEPALFALVSPLRALLARLMPRGAAAIELVLADQGADCLIAGPLRDGLAEAEALGGFAADHALARLAVDRGDGPVAIWEPDPVTVTLSGVPVPLPHGAFLQATRDGEAALVAAAAAALDGCMTVADLFSGLGTFAMALAPGRRVYAAEASAAAHLACKAAANRAGRAVYPAHRDLFRNPLLADELDRFAAVLLDPPRAGAREQVDAIAASRLGRVAYASCNPASWSRDAARLAAAGFVLEAVWPVGQFRWSTHVELMSLFRR